MSSGKTRGRAIIDFIGLYRIVTAEAVRRVFGFADQGEVEKALAQLVRAGFLEEYRGKNALVGTLPYWTLSRKGADIAGVSAERAGSPGEQAIWQHLATLWFCVMGQGRRYRLEPEDLGEVFGDTPHVNTIHAADQAAVYRLYVSSTKAEAAVKQIKSHIESAQKKPGFRAAIDRGELRFVVIVETEEEERKIKKRLLREGLSNRVSVERAPGPSTTPRG